MKKKKVDGKSKKRETRKKTEKKQEQKEDSDFDIDSDGEVFNKKDETNYGDMVASIRKNVGAQDNGGADEESDNEDAFSDASGGEGAVDLLSMLNDLDKKPAAEHARGEVRPESIHNVNTTEGLTLEDILAPLEGEFQSVQKDLTEVEKTVALPEAVGHVKAAKAERELGYETAKKDVQKWIPQVKQNREAKQLVFGDAKGDEVSAKSLVADFKPSTDFEKELQDAIEKSGVSETLIRRSNTGDLPMEEVRGGTSSSLARLKFLMGRAQAKNKRVNKIKAKAYHRLKRQGDKKMHDKVLERLEQEDPELAEEMKRDIEKKRATMRMQRQTNARKKWALQAARFGGKETRQAVSKQAQVETDEKAALRRATKGKKEHDEDSDSEIDVEGQDADETVAKTKQLAMLELQSDDEECEGHQGLMGLKFMQEAIRRKREDAKRDAQQLLDDMDALKGDGSDQDRDEDIEGDEPQIGDSKPAFSAEELAAAAASLDAKASASMTVSGPVSISTEKPKKKKKRRKDAADVGVAAPCASKTTDTARTAPVSTSADPAEAATPAAPSSLPVGTTAKKGDTLSGSAIPTQESGYTPSSPSRPRAAIARPRKDDVVPEDIFASLDFTNAQPEVQAAFATGTHEEDFEEAAKAKNAPKEVDDGKLPGWGGWTGEGIVPRKKRPAPIEPLAPKAKRVQKFEGVDAKSQKYCVENVPHPFQSQKQYEESLRMPTGRDWNSAAVHRRKIMPRVITKAGAVITPIQFAKQLPPTERDSLLEAWTAKRAVRCKARL